MSVKVMTRKRRGEMRKVDRRNQVRKESIQTKISN